MARLYADENFPDPAVRRLRELGHDVLTAREAANADREVPDQEVLQFALGQARALLTLNRRDVIRLHAQVVKHAGLVVCTEDKDFAALADRIEHRLRSAGSLDGQLIRVTRPG